MFLGFQLIRWLRARGTLDPAKELKNALEANLYLCNRTGVLTSDLLPPIRLSP